MVGGYRYHWHDSLEIQLIVAGECEICVDGSIHYLVPDDLILINSGCGHASLRHRGDCFSIVTYASPDYLRELGLDLDQVQLYCDSAADGTRASPLFRSLREKLCRCLLSFQTESHASAIAARAYFELFLASLLEYSPPRELDKRLRKKDKAQQEFMLSVMKYIGGNYRKKIGLDDVARFAGYNSSYFSTFFKSVVAIGFQEYLTRYRLQSAIIDLMENDKSVADTAQDNGFSDIKAFNQAFQRVFHKSPSEYRKSEKHTLPTPNTLNRKLVEEDNPVVVSYLRRYSVAEETGKGVPEPDSMREMTLSFRADQTAAELLSQLERTGIRISLDTKK